MENARGRYSGHGYRKFFTVTDLDTGSRFCTLCQVNDQSIYKRLRNLIQQDIEKNSDIIEDILQPKSKKEKPKTQLDADTSQSKSIPFPFFETKSSQKSQTNAGETTEQEKIKTDTKQDEEEYDPLSDPKFPELYKKVLKENFPDIYK